MNSTPGPELIEATRIADSLGLALVRRADLTSYVKLNDAASAFIAYYTKGGGCSNCGGLPHTRECFVRRFLDAYGHDCSTPTPAQECCGPGLHLVNCDCQQPGPQETDR